MSIHIKLLITVLGLLCVVIYQVPGAASARSFTCTFSEIAKHFDAGLQSAASGRHADSLAKLLILANAGFGPAQREISKSMARGHVVERSTEKAALWAELSFRSGDREARKLSDTYRSMLTVDQRRQVSAATKAWAARAVSCPGGRMKFHGKASSTKTPLSIKIEFYKQVKSELRSSLTAKINTLLERAVGSEPSARLYLGIIDEIEVYKGSRYHRYLGWRQNSTRNILRFASSNLQDVQPDIMANALIVEVKRRAYTLMPGAEYADPHLRRFNGKYFFGSAYPDINNGRFFKLMRQAFAMIKRLPGDVRATVEAIDEIHYNPQSKHFLKYGVADSSGAYYNKILSSDALSMMFVRREALYSSPLFFVRILVHEGTHAIQDRRAKENLTEIRKIKKYMINLERSNRKDSRRYRDLRKQIDDRMDYARRWFRGIKTKDGKWVQDISFECEATLNEIKALKALNASPRALDDSGYLSVCPSAQRVIKHWKASKGIKNR